MFVVFAETTCFAASKYNTVNSEIISLKTFGLLALHVLKKLGLPSWCEMFVAFRFCEFLKEKVTPETVYFFEITNEKITLS